MPTEAPRKSSIGNSRRGPPKAHVPYRGDNREVGRKTGVKIQRVQPGSDGFEPFENVIGQADNMTPYQVKSRKRNNGSLAANELDPDHNDGDDQGEIDMDIDSPIDYISNSRQPASPAVSRVGSSRAVARPSLNDFDELPSPHIRSGFRSKSTNGHGPGPSRLSRMFPSNDQEEDDLSMNRAFDDFDQPDSSPQHRSFTELDQDGGIDDEGGPSSPTVSPPRSSRMDKQRQRQTPHRSPSPDMDPPSPPRSDIEMEPQDFDEADQQSDDDEEEAPSNKMPSPPPKKTKEVQRKVTKSSAKKENREVISGTRRSTRKVYKPLEFWRNERVVYGRPNNGHILVPHIKEIIRIPEEPKVSLGSKRKRGRSRTLQPRDGSIVKVVPTSNPEEGWDDETPEKSLVIDWKTQTEIEKRITCLAKAVDPQPAANNEWLFQKIFGDDQFIAAGQLVIPKDGKKPSKSAKDNTYIFYIIEGAINLRVHESSLLLCTGAMFMVPRGNQYYIENVGNRDARLFFTQARKNEDTYYEAQERADDARSAPPRSSSAVVATGKSKTGPSKRAKTSSG
ncbi:hypothetical protein K435DRAFT_730030 [Dendrothele bispora CBS 962.96]|uniref:CENP-C homolog n=1 Tax=Dendrothele bispora (strain CBS 962.96) TaxID=1314807 RepID=A0A4S8LE78_DENBC|nr:hypothetical protein K435DRAFT_762781 [Dendrothele bispora CBS 962.96]THU88433.1 hypothetical protein K435DRAFT_730030 [Dendrothele bispora CBS 962.96]